MKLDFEVIQPEVGELVPTAIQEKVKEELTALFSGATIEVIETPEQLNNTVALVQQTKGKLKDWEEERKKETVPIDKKKDSIQNFWNPIKAAAKRLIDNLELRAGQYKHRIEQKQQEDQRKADEEARIKRLQAEEEGRKKREAEEAQRREAEKKRQEAEAAKRREQEQRDAAERARIAGEQAKTKAAREKAEKEQREAEAKAKTEKEASEKASQEAINADKQAEREAQKAESKEAVALSTVARVVAAPPVPKGLKAEYEYWPEVMDGNAFMAWAVANDKFHFLQINEKVLEKYVNLEKDAFKAPGVVVKKDIKGSIMSIRKKKAA